MGRALFVASLFCLRSISPAGAEVPQGSEGLPGAAGPRVEFLNKNPVGVQVLDAEVNPDRAAQTNEPARVLPTATRRLSFRIRTRGSLPDRTAIEVDVANRDGPVRREGTVMLVGKFDRRTGEATYQVFAPGDEPYPDGPYRGTVTIGGVAVAVLNWSVGGPEPPGQSSETPSPPAQAPTAAVAAPEREPEPKPERPFRDESLPQAAAPPPSLEPTVFGKVDYCERQGDKVKSRRAQLIIDPGRRLLTFAAEDDPGRPFQAVPWDRITNITYEHTEFTRVKTAIVVPWSLFFRGKKHWLTVTYGPGDRGEPGGAAVARLDKASYQAILATINGQTGIEVHQIGDEGEVSVLYRASPARFPPGRQAGPVPPPPPLPPNVPETSPPAAQASDGSRTPEPSRQTPEAEDTPLNLAARAADGRLVSRLVAEGADVNARGKDAMAPLHHAAWAGQKDMAALLLSRGADVNAKDSRGATPLHWAAIEDNRDVAEVLLAGGARVDASDAECVPLRVHQGLYVFAPVGKGHTPLHWAGERGTGVLTLLLAHGAEVDARSSGQGRTPLYSAVIMGNKAAVEVLLGEGADARVKDGSGDTPLHVAASVGKHEQLAVAEALLAAGAEVDARNGDGKTPLDRAGSEEMKALLRRHGAR